MARVPVVGELVMGLLEIEKVTAKSAATADYNDKKHDISTSVTAKSAVTIDKKPDISISVTAKSAATIDKKPDISTSVTAKSAVTIDKKTDKEVCYFFRDLTERGIYVLYILRWRSRLCFNITVFEYMFYTYCGGGQGYV